MQYAALPKATTIEICLFSNMSKKFKLKLTWIYFKLNFRGLYFLLTLLWTIRVQCSSRSPDSSYSEGLATLGDLFSRKIFQRDVSTFRSQVLVDVFDVFGVFDVFLRPTAEATCAAGPAAPSTRASFRWLAPLSCQVGFSHMILFMLSL